MLNTIDDLHVQRAIAVLAASQQAASFALADVTGDELGQIMGTVSGLKLALLASIP